MNSWILLLSLAALILILLEVLVVPGFGLVGISGGLALMVAAYLTSQTYGLFWGLGLFLGVGALCVLGFILFMKSPLANWIILQSSHPRESLSPTSIDLKARGVAKTDLRPTGKALFILDGREKVIDVVTAGDFVERDQSIEVIAIEGTRVVVERKI